MDYNKRTYYLKSQNYSYIIPRAIELLRFIASYSYLANSDVTIVTTCYLDYVNVYIVTLAMLLD